MPKRRKKLFLIVLTFFVILLLGKFFSNPLNNIFHKVFSPVEKYLWKKGQETGTFFFYLFQAKNIYNENLFLKEQNTILARKNSELFDLAKENETLTQAFNLGKKENFYLFPSQIISKQALKDIILIDKGAKHGLAEGMPVITASGILIGNIKKANNNFSEVSLITLKDFSFDVEIGELVALAKGEGSLNLSFDFADKENAIAEKSLVFTSELGGNFPKNLLVGEIEKSEVNPAGLFQTGKIKPYFKENLFSSVFVIQNFQSIGD